MSDKNKTLIVIAGPTASGKTAFAIELAKALDTVILSADSRQFYKEMSIGTAAPTAEELRQAKHYFVHHISIEDKYDVADYEQDVIQLLDALFKTHDAVIMTGGSGLFIDAVCNGTLNYYSAEHESIDVTLSPDAEHASIRGRSRVNAAVFGGDRHTWHLQQDLKAEKRDGRWLLVESRASTY